MPFLDFNSVDGFVKTSRGTVRTGKKDGLVSRLEFQLAIERFLGGSGDFPIGAYPNKMPMGFFKDLTTPVKVERGMLCGKSVGCINVIRESITTKAFSDSVFYKNCGKDGVLSKSEFYTLVERLPKTLPSIFDIKGRTFDL